MEYPAAPVMCFSTKAKVKLNSRLKPHFHSAPLGGSISWRICKRLIYFLGHGIQGPWHFGSTTLRAASLQVNARMLYLYLAQKRVRCPAGICLIITALLCLLVCPLPYFANSIPLCKQFEFETRPPPSRAIPLLWWEAGLISLPHSHRTWRKIERENWGWGMGACVGNTTTTYYPRSII